MKSSTFPIVEIENNKLIALDGNVAHFYELLAPDIDQYSSFEKDRFFSGIAGSLNNLPDDAYVKFYKISKRSFVETNSVNEPELRGVKMTPSSDHLTEFFKGSDLFSDLAIFDDYLLVNGQYLKVFSVLQFSENEIDESLIPIDLDYVLKMRKLEKIKANKLLDRIRTKHQSSFSKNKRDMESEGAYTQAEELLNDLAFERESIFQMELFFILRGDTAVAVNEEARRLQSFMASKDIKLFLEDHDPLRAKSSFAAIFNELIPGVAPKFDIRTHTNKTSHLCYLLPLKRSHLMDRGILFHDQNDDEILFNPFCKEIKNRNMLVTGLTGGGKSVFVNKLVHHLIGHHPTVILDKGGSFKRLTTYHQGVELRSGFNPMQFLDPLYLREFILSVVDKEKFDKLSRGKLLNEIKKYLQACTDYRFETLLSFLEESFTGIHYYFEDIKEFFTQSSLKVESILYVDVENYPKNIISPLIIFLLEYFKSIPEKEKILVFDECWSFLTNHAEFIDECFRTFRKTGAFPIAISQGLNDFKVLGGELSSSISNNSYFKVFFPQEIGASDEISEFDLQNINSLDFEKGIFSDCYLKSSDSKYRKIIRNYLTPLELELFHTEAGEADRLNRFLDRNHEFFENNKRAMDAFVGLKYAQDTFSFNDNDSHIWS